MTVWLPLSKDLNIYGRTKHVYNHYSGEVSTKEMVLKHISTARMIAVPLTKVIGRNLFRVMLKVYDFVKCDYA